MSYKILNGSLSPKTQCQHLRPDERPELVYIQVRDKHFAYDPNSHACLEINSPRDYKDLRENPPSPYIMAKYKPVFKRNFDTTVRSMVLESTHDCNLACSYCFVRNYYSDHGTGNFMQFPTAKRAIDQLLNPANGLSLGFFGGEPLLNMKLIKEVVEYCEMLMSTRGPICNMCKGSGNIRGGKCGNCHGTCRQRPSFHVTTNGTLYSEENIKFLNDHGFSLITSIDGDEESHDALRPMKRSGKGSYKNIVEGLKRLSKYPIAQRNTLRSTFTMLRSTSLKDRLEHLNQFCDDGWAGHVSVEPAAMSENSCFIPNQDDLEIHIGNVWNFYDEYLEAADWWVDRAMAGKTPRWHNVHKSIERIFWSIHAGTECGAGVGYVGVNSKGEIFGCHRESNSFLGTLVTGIDEKLRAPWLDNRIYNRTGCMTCGHRYACGGGCREDSLGDKGNIHEPSNVHCAFKDMWVRSALWIMSKCPKDLIAKYVRNPQISRGGAGTPLQSWIPESALPRDDNGIVQQKWIGNIPITALVKEGYNPEKHSGIHYQDEPADLYAADVFENPALPESPLAGILLK